MAFRYARTHENGLVVAPPQLDCVGNGCPVAAELGACFISKHHLYFPHEDYESPLLNEFRNNPFNIINMPRCRHTTYHRQIDGVYAPEDDVIEDFLHEAAILSDLGITTRDVIQQRQRLAAAPKTKPWVRIEFSPHGREWFEFIHEMKQQELNALVDLALRSVEVIPARQILSGHVLGAKAIRGVLAPLLPAV